MSGYEPDPLAETLAPDPLLEAAALQAGLSAATARGLARGAAIYARGLFWEAHEAWEGPWTAEQGEPRLLLQGLIQVAAAFHKALVQKQSGGCVRLFASALEKLRPLGGACGGLDLAGFRAAAERAQAVAVAWHEGRGEPPGRELAPVIAPLRNVGP